jgi:hypothetical protein
MSVIRRPGAASRLVLAIALSSAAALAAATPAQAAKKEEQAQAPKAELSKEFATAYKPYFEVVKAKGDVTTLKDSLPAIQAAAKTPDDKFTAGQATYSIGLKLSDVAMQRKGVDMMVDSGSKLAAGELGNLLFGAARLAYDAKDWATARSRAQQAIAAGYSGDANLLMAETYFGENQAAAGLDLLDKAIAQKVAAGQTVPDSWLKRGLAIAANAKLEPQSAKFAGLYAQYYPSAASWGDAIAIQRNFNNFDGQDLLDLMRLAERTNSLRSERDYVDYIAAADARRLPGETQRIIKAGLAAGKLRSGDVFVSEANSISSARVQADLADLPKLGSDARAAGATVATLMAAGDAFLSYQKPAEAEQFYTAALAKPGVDTARVLTRLGIAQADQGKSAEAAATFAKVTGPRKPIADLWGLYVKQAKAPAAQ